MENRLCLVMERVCMLEPKCSEPVEDNAALRFAWQWQLLKLHGAFYMSSFGICQGQAARWFQGATTVASVRPSPPALSLSLHGPQKFAKGSMPKALVLMGHVLEPILSKGTSKKR